MSLPFAGAEPVAQTRVIPVTDESQVGEARRAVRALSAQLHLDETAAGRVSVVVTELATNVARHGAGGRLLARAIAGATGIEVLAVDAGPGMSNLENALRDGFSTGGPGSGTGLGAVRRMSDVFDVYTRPGGGAVVLARMLRLREGPLPLEPLELGAVSVAAPGEQQSGDGWTVMPGQRGPAVVVVDGLGHGAAAHVAATRAIDACCLHPGRSPGDLIGIMHDALRGTRGAAAAVAELDETAQVVRFAGVGNISCSVTDDSGSRSLASLSGIVGHEMRSVHEFGTAMTPGALLVMHSDGVATRWRLDQYPGIRPRHPSLAAALLFRDYLRGRDDATVIVARARRTSGGAAA